MPTFEEDDPDAKLPSIEQAQHDLRLLCEQNPANVFYRLCLESYETAGYLRMATLGKQLDMSIESLRRIKYAITRCQEIEIAQDDFGRTASHSGWLNHALDSINSAIFLIGSMTQREKPPAVYGYITGMLAGWSLGMHDSRSPGAEAASTYAAAALKLARQRAAEATNNKARKKRQAEKDEAAKIFHRELLRGGKRETAYKAIEKELRISRTKIHEFRREGAFECGPSGGTA